MGTKTKVFTFGFHTHRTQIESYIVSLSILIKMSCFRHFIWFAKNDSFVLEKRLAFIKVIVYYELVNQTKGLLTMLHPVQTTINKFSQPSSQLSAVDIETIGAVLDGLSDLADKHLYDFVNFMLTALRNTKNYDSLSYTGIKKLAELINARNRPEIAIIMGWE